MEARVPKRTGLLPRYYPCSRPLTLSIYCIYLSTPKAASPHITSSQTCAQEVFAAYSISRYHAN
jgi:hypothetical protein